MPVVSVVIPTYDAGHRVDASIESALAQDVDVEIVVVDGGSSDDTAARARRYEGVVVDVAPDRGVYDAMNRAWPLTTAPYLHYLGAGDTLRPGAFAALLADGPPDDERELLAYGDVWMAGRGVYTYGPFDGDRFASRFGICHQALLWDRRTVARLGGYRLRHRVHADHMLTMRAFGDPMVAPRYVPRVVANFEGGGISDHQPDPGTGLDFPAVIAGSFGVEVPRDAWTQPIWPDPVHLCRGLPLEVGRVTPLGAWLHVGLVDPPGDRLERAWISNADGRPAGTLQRRAGDEPVVVCWLAGWRPGPRRTRVDAFAGDGRRRTADLDLDLDADAGAGTFLSRGDVPTVKLREVSGRALAEGAPAVVVLGSSDVTTAALGRARLVPRSVSTVDHLAEAALDGDGLVVVVDAGCEPGHEALAELVAEHASAPGAALLYGDEVVVGDDGRLLVDLKQGFSPTRCLFQDHAGPVIAVDVPTARAAVALDAAPVRTTGELVLRLLDVPVNARRVPRVLSRRSASLALRGASPDAVRAAVARRGWEVESVTALDGIVPAARDVRWRPQRTGRVSLVVSVPLGEPGAAERIAALRSGTDWPDLEVVVVDCVLDGLPPLDGVRVVPGPRSARPAAMAAAGAAAASGDTLVLADEWTEAGDPAWLALLLSHLDDPWVAVAGPYVVGPDRRELVTTGWWVDRRHGPVPAAASPVPRGVTAVSSPGLTIRRDRWEALGGPALDLPGLHHDVDLCRRAQVGGARVVVDPRSRLVHHGLATYPWPWDEGLRDRLDARAAGTPDPVDTHAHPLLDPWHRGGLLPDRQRDDD